MVDAAQWKTHWLSFTCAKNSRALGSHWQQQSNTQAGQTQLDACGGCRENSVLGAQVATNIVLFNGPHSCSMRRKKRANKTEATSTFGGGEVSCSSPTVCLPLKEWRETKWSSSVTTTIKNWLKIQHGGLEHKVLTPKRQRESLLCNLLWAFPEMRVEPSSGCGGRQEWVPPQDGEGRREGRHLNVTDSHSDAS